MLRVGFLVSALLLSGCAIKSETDVTIDDDPLETEARRPTEHVVPAEQKTCGYAGDIPCDCWEMCLQHRCVDVRR